MWTWKTFGMELMGVVRGALLRRGTTTPASDCIVIYDLRRRIRSHGFEPRKFHWIRIESVNLRIILDRHKASRGAATSLTLCLIAGELH